MWLLGVWQTGEAARRVSATHPERMAEYRRVLPDFRDSDVCGSCSAVRDYHVHRDFGGGEALARLRFSSMWPLHGSLTEKRLELERFVADHEGINARQLAAAVDRDYKNLHGDVGKLCEPGLLEKRDGGHYAPELTTRYALRVAA